MFKKLVLVLLLTLTLPGLLLADTYMKQRTHTDAVVIMGQTQPAQDSVDEIWIKSGMVNTRSGSQGSLLRLDQKKLYNLNHAAKSYTEQSLNFGKLMNDAGMTAEQQALLKKYAGSMLKASITVKDTGETKKIGKWNCRKYVQTIKSGAGPITAEIWTTTDIKADYGQLAEWQAALKKKTILTSTARYLLVDHSKFGHRALALFARLDQFDLVITDAGTPTAIQEDLRKRAVKVEVAV